MISPDRSSESQVREQRHELEQALPNEACEELRQTTVPNSIWRERLRQKLSPLLAALSSPQGARPTLQPMENFSADEPLIMFTPPGRLTFRLSNIDAPPLDVGNARAAAVSAA